MLYEDGVAQDGLQSSHELDDGDATVGATAEWRSCASGASALERKGLKPVDLGVVEL